MNPDPGIERGRARRGIGRGRCGGVSGFPALLGFLVLSLAGLGAGSGMAADVAGYSVIKGEFFNQRSPTEWVLDPTFGFSVLGSVELTDFDLLTAARIRLPQGDAYDLESLGDSWSWLDSYETQEELDEEYPWGDYFLIFETENEGDFSCLLEFPETALPPIPHLVNFDAVQVIDPTRPLTLTWEFSVPPASNDFVQVYINLGHGEVFSTPNLGEPGALRPTDRSVTVPADSFVGGFVHELNLEITRLVSTNATCHPTALGVAGVFRSTSIDIVALTPPLLRLLPRPAGGSDLPAVEVVAEPEQPVVLEGTPDFRNWSPVATNAATSGTNVFALPAGPGSPRFFRAVLH